jgi:hypothetical protein
MFSRVLVTNTVPLVLRPLLVGFIRASRPMVTCFRLSLPTGGSEAAMMVV